jgi:hypothetical protein
MNLSYNQGAVSKLMIINILLVLLIGVMGFVLLAPEDQNKAPQIIATTPAVTKTSPSTSLTPANSRAEIDALKKQLASETSKLKSLRVGQEQQLEARRNAEELEVVITVDVPTENSPEAAPQAAEDTVDETANGVPGTTSPTKKPDQ